ncbi:MAG: transcription elongation factor Spt5 [Promethearchaeota archaeon]
MANTEENGEEKTASDIKIDEISSDIEESKEDLTTLFAVRTTINQESNILRQIFYRFKILDVVPDIKAMFYSPQLPGYIFLEAPQKRDVQIAIQNIPKIKGRIVQNISLDELKNVLLPRKITEYVEEGDTVEIISGVFEGSKAVVLRMPHDSSSSEEVVLRLLQEETPITIKLHGDYLKLVEKKKEEVPMEPIPEIQVKAEDTEMDLDKAISFDDEYEEYEEEIGTFEDEEASVEYEDDEEEWEEDDEWSKFDGF